MFITNILSDIVSIVIVMIAIFGWWLFFSGFLKVKDTLDYLQSKCDCRNCEVIKRGNKKTKVRCYKCGSIFKVQTSTVNAEDRKKQENLKCLDQ
jgi:hypothetical protein